jgi:hypothetical protein
MAAHRRFTNTDWSRAEREMPWRVDMRVPAFGFGEDLNRMHQWCALRGTFRRDWFQWGYQGEADPAVGRVDYIRFYFLQQETASALAAAWPQYRPALRGAAPGTAAAAAVLSEGRMQAD